MGNQSSINLVGKFNLKSINSQRFTENNLKTNTNMNNVYDIVEKQKNILNNLLYEITNDNKIDNIYDSQFIILGSYNTIIKAYHIRITRKNCPFSRPRLAVPDKEYKKIYIAFPVITEIATFHINELKHFYKIYSEQKFHIFLGIYDNPNMENQVYKTLPKNNRLKIFHIDHKDKCYYETIGIDFTTRFNQISQPILILNGCSNDTIISSRNKTKWDIFNMNVGFTKFISIFKKDFDGQGDSVSIIRRINDIQSIILDQIDNLDKTINLDDINSFCIPQILITGSLAKTLRSLNLSNIKYIDEMISPLEDEIVNMCWTTDPIDNMYSFYYKFSNVILMSEIFKYLTCNINKKIRYFVSATVTNNNVNLCNNWIMGKLLIDNEIYKY